MIIIKNKAEVAAAIILAVGEEVAVTIKNVVEAEVDIVINTVEVEEADIPELEMHHHQPYFKNRQIQSIQKLKRSCINHHPQLNTEAQKEP